MKYKGYMLKAHYILRYLLSNRLLRPLCALLNLSYVYMQRITSHLQVPTAQIQTKLKPVILPSYWFEETTQEFCQMLKNELNLSAKNNFMKKSFSTDILTLTD